MTENEKSLTARVILQLLGYIEQRAGKDEAEQVTAALAIANPELTQILTGTDTGTRRTVGFAPQPN